MLTLVVIAFNESDRIGRCLSSVPIAAHKLVLDSGSTDSTVEVARRAGAEVVRTDWPGFVAQKNRALDRVRTPWALSLDADEWLTDEAVADIERVLQAEGKQAGWSFPRANRWLGRTVEHGAWYPDRKLRLIRSGAGHWVGDDPHDRLEVRGDVGELQGDIGHEPYRGFRDHLRTIDRYTRIHAGALAARGVVARRRDPVLHALAHFGKSYLLQQGFRDGSTGLALAALGAAHSGLKWHRLRALCS